MGFPKLSYFTAKNNVTRLWTWHLHFNDGLWEEIRYRLGRFQWLLENDWGDEKKTIKSKNLVCEAFKSSEKQLAGAIGIVHKVELGL